MATALELKQEQREAFIRMFYGIVSGAEGRWISQLDLMNISGHLRISDEEAGQILRYWIGEQFIQRKPAAESYSLTHKGVVFVEQLMQRDVASQPNPAAPSPKQRTSPETRTKSIRHAGTILNVLIASPSDVNQERDVVAKAISDWNAAHFRSTGIMLNPIRWETHSFPASGDRPQAIINKQIASEGDFLLGIFGNRLGTPTGKAASGTIEEIEEFRSSDKHVALYFSVAPLPRDADREQLRVLEKYQEERKKDTLYDTFKTPEELRERVSHHLPMIVDAVHKQLRASGDLEDVEQELWEPNRYFAELKAAEGREKEIDTRVLEALGRREQWAGVRPFTGAGEPAVRAAEIAAILGLDVDVVADSLERLESQGRAKNAGGTLDNPAPYWFIRRR